LGGSDLPPEQAAKQLISKIDNVLTISRMVFENLVVSLAVIYSPAFSLAVSI
jgi:methyl coenzyme M reductase subunit D